jgi:IS5 family transposase
LSTKIHALVDALGNPLRFLLTPGQAHDLIGADALLPQMAAEVLIADKAYDADERVLKLLARAENPPSSRLGKTEQRPASSMRRSTRRAT